MSESEDQEVEIKKGEEHLEKLKSSKKIEEDRLSEVNEAIQNQHKIEQTLEQFNTFLVLMDAVA